MRPVEEQKQNETISRLESQMTGPARTSNTVMPSLDYYAHASATNHGVLQYLAMRFLLGFYHFYESGISTRHAHSRIGRQKKLPARLLPGGDRAKP